MKYLIRALGLVLLLEVVLIITGIVPANAAVILLVITEGTALLLGGTIVFKAVRKINSKVKEGERVYTALESSLKDVLPPKALFMVKHEIGMFASIIRLITGKKDIPEGASEIKYGQQLRQLIGVLLLVSVAEIVVVAFLIPWEILRIIILVLSIYGLLWLVGFMAATSVYPHYINNRELVIRSFHFHTLSVPISAVTRALSNNREAAKNKTVLVKDKTVSLNVFGETNVDLYLSKGEIISHNKIALSDIERVSFSVDDCGLASEHINQKVSEVSQPAA